MRWLLLLLLVPIGHGYTLELEAPPLGPIPAGGEATWNITWRLTCDGAPGTGSGTLVLDFPDDLDLAFSGPDAVIAALPDCVAQQTTSDIVAITVGDLGARGVIPIAVPLNGTMYWQTPQGRADARLDGSVEVAFDGILEVKTPTKLKQGQPGTETSFAVEVTNFGNAPVFVAIEQLEGNDNWVFPARFPGTPLGVMETRSLELVYKNPSGGVWTNEEGGWSGTFTPIAAEDEDQSGTQVTVNLVNRTRGTPAPALPLIAVGLVAIALAKRR